jgi:hypothetical protein
MSIIETLTEGIVNRDMKKEGAALLNKWTKTGLLEGLQTEHQKSTMARLLENQAKELLRESTAMTGGEVEGFAAVAFPIVRRVFAGLIANDLVSVQPMSLPSGLIFFLDFKFSDDVAGQDPRLGQASTDSIYGQGVVGSELINGVSLASEELDKQPYAFGSAYSSPTGSINAASLTLSAVTLGLNGATLATAPDGATEVGNLVAADELAGSLIGWDADLLDEHSGSFLLVRTVDFSSITDFNEDHLSQIVLPLSGATSGPVGTQVRRLTKEDPNNAGNLLFFYVNSTALDVGTIGAISHDAGSYEKRDTYTTTGLSAGVVAADIYSLENNANIPEIDIKVDSTAITATTKKLKAKWTPELGQDLNAYHNLDAEVELTSILSEQIALEIDREILADLVNGATAGTFYWSRSPGLFVDRTTGKEIGANTAAPDFTGTVSEWYETLIETINDVSAQIHRKTLRGGANFVVVSPEVANILEFTSGFRANVTADADKGDIGAVKVGSLSRKFDVIVDPYFPRNVLLVGRKGSSFLESGYVYAPYVPLQTTPTIFDPESFVPRKGVMTRYAKKMVRPDMYGLVIVRGLLGESGS